MPSPTPDRGISRRQLLAATGAAAVAGGAAATGATLLATRNAPAAGAAASIPPGSGPVLAFTELGNGIPLPSSIPADASPEFRAVAEALLASMRQSPVPGAALAVLHHGREQFAYFGIESLNSHVTVGPDTLFQLGSLTKTYTATAVWRLIDEGKLGVNARVRDYLPDLRLADEDTAAKITVGQLLDHTAGFYGSDGGYAGEDDNAVARYVSERLPTLPQLAPLGVNPSYNNDGFILLGRLIEVVTGTPYRAALASLVLGPLQLGNTLLDRQAALTRPHVDGHYEGPINGTAVRFAVQTPLFVPRAVEPAGGLWATVRDVLAYGRFHLTLGREGPGRGTVATESLQQMQTPAKTWPGLDLSIGRNWFVQEAGGRRAFTHNGDTAGCHAVFLAVPDEQLALALLVNTGGGFAAERAVLNTVATSYPGLAAFNGTFGTTQSLLAAPNTPTVTLPPSGLAQYAGSYADPGQTVTITAGGPQGAPLAMTQVLRETPNGFQAEISGPGAPAVGLTFVGKDAGLINGIERIAFLRDDAGNVGWQAQGLRLTPRTQRPG